MERTEFGNAEQTKKNGMVQWTLSVCCPNNLGTMLGHSHNLLLEASSSPCEGFLLASNGEARRAQLLISLGTAQSIVDDGKWMNTWASLLLAGDNSKVLHSL